MICSATQEASTTHLLQLYLHLGPLWSRWQILISIRKNSPLACVPALFSLSVTLTLWLVELSSVWIRPRLTQIMFVLLLPSCLFSWNHKPLTIENRNSVMVPQQKRIYRGIKLLKAFVRILSERMQEITMNTIWAVQCRPKLCYLAGHWEMYEYEKVVDLHLLIYRKCLLKQISLNYGISCMNLELKVACCT